jgi:hypothetical protein
MLKLRHFTINHSLMQPIGIPPELIGVAHVSVPERRKTLGIGPQPVFEPGPHVAELIRLLALQNEGQPVDSGEIDYLEDRLNHEHYTMEDELRRKGSWTLMLTGDFYSAQARRNISPMTAEARAKSWNKWVAEHGEAPTQPPEGTALRQLFDINNPIAQTNGSVASWEIYQLVQAMRKARTNPHRAYRWNRRANSIREKLNGTNVRRHWQLTENGVEEGPGDQTTGLGDFVYNLFGGSR